MKFVSSLIIAFLSIIILTSCTSNSAQIIIPLAQQDTVIRKIKDKINRLTIDTKSTAFKKMKQLTAIDFAGHQLNFENNRITPKR